MSGQRKVDCRKFLTEVSSYIDGDLDPELRSHLESHLNNCQDCWVMFDETRRTVEIIENTDCHPLPDEMRERLLKTLRERMKSS
jgi:mycothiol system anti-sigma-R factor